MAPMPRAVEACYQSKGTKHRDDTLGSASTPAVMCAELLSYWSYYRPRFSPRNC